MAGHVILVTAYDTHPSRQQALTAYTIDGDGVRVEFTPQRPAVRLQWQLAWTAWAATKGLPGR